MMKWIKFKETWIDSIVWIVLLLTLTACGPGYRWTPLNEWDISSILDMTVFDWVGLLVFILVLWYSLKRTFIGKMIMFIKGGMDDIEAEMSEKEKKELDEWSERRAEEIIAKVKSKLSYWWKLIKGNK